MVRRAEEHRLALEVRTLLPVAEDTVDHVRRLFALVAAGHESGPGAALPLGPQRLVVALGRLGDDRVRRAEHRRRAAVVALEGEHGGRGEPGGEVEDVAHRRRPEPVDRLGIVTHHRQPPATWPERFHDICLHGIGVLVLVHQHRIEAVADQPPECVIGEHALPEEQQVVVVEHVRRFLAVHILREEALEIVRLALAPRESRLEHVAERLGGVHAAGVDVEARPLLREPSRSGAEVELRTRCVHEVFRVGAVKDRESRREPDRPAVHPQQSRGHRVERASPDRGAGARVRELPAIGCAAQQRLSAPEHLVGGASGEGQEKDASRRRPPGDQVCHAVGECGGLAGPRPGHDEQGAVTVGDRSALRVVEFL